MEFDENLIERSLKIWNFDVNQLSIRAIQHVQCMNGELQLRINHYYMLKIYNVAWDYMRMEMVLPLQSSI